MGFLSQTFIDDYEVTPANLNQLNENTVFLFDRLIPLLNQNCVAIQDYGLYVVHFSLIDPNQASGSGSYGATWTKIWQGGGAPNSFAMAVGIPSTIFSSTPFVVGHTTGSQSQWGIIPCSRWGESATGFSVAFRDSGGATYPINSGFSYTALLVGPRKTDPT